MTDPALLELLFRELQAVLDAAWTRRGRGHTPRTSRGWSVYMRGYARDHAPYGKGPKGLSLAHRVKLARAIGGNAGEVVRQFQEEARVHEEAVCRSIRHLLSRIREVAGDIDLPPAYEAMTRVAEHRLGHAERTRQKIEKMKATKAAKRRNQAGEEPK